MARAVEAEHVAQSLDVGRGAAGRQAQGPPALQGIGQHGDDALAQAAALQVLLADQVVAAGDLELVVVVGQVDQEAQVGQHGLGDGAGDGLAELVGLGFAGQGQQGVEGLGVGAVAAALARDRDVLLLHRCDATGRQREALRQGHQHGEGCQLHQTNRAGDAAVLAAGEHIQQAAGEEQGHDRHAIPPAVRAADQQDDQAKDGQPHGRHLPGGVIGRPVKWRLDGPGGSGVGDRRQAEPGGHQHTEQPGRGVGRAAGLREGPQPDHPHQGKGGDGPVEGRQDDLRSENSQLSQDNDCKA